MAEAKWKETDFVYQADDAKVQSLMESFDPEMRFRALKGTAARVVLIMCIILALFHIYTAGFGVLQEWKHRCLSLYLRPFPGLPGLSHPEGQGQKPDHHLDL